MRGTARLWEMRRAHHKLAGGEPGDLRKRKRRSDEEHHEAVGAPGGGPPRQKHAEEIACKAEDPRWILRILDVPQQAAGSMKCGAHTILNSLLGVNAT